MKTLWLRSVIGGAVCLAAFGAAGGGALRGQAPAQVAVSVGVVPFHDESGTGVPAMGPGVAQLLRQRLSSRHKDTLAKALSTEATGAGEPATVEALQAAGRQHAVTFVVQGGVLPVEVSGDPSALVVSLFADVVEVESGQARTLRVEASAPAPPDGLGLADPASMAVTKAEFAKTPVGQALANAVDQLADAVYGVVTGAAPAADRVPDDAPVGEAAAWEVPAATPEDDADLQQLVADAQNAIAYFGGAAPDLAERVRVGLEQLSAALSQKADQLARGEDTHEVDASVAASKASLRAAVDALVQAQADAQASMPDGQTGAPSEGVMSRVNTFANDLLSLVQKIQELEALVGGAGAEAAAAEAPQEMPGGEWGGAGAVEEEPGTVTGVVVDEGQPVSGAEVTETSTGSTTTTGPDGSFTLSPLPPGLLGVLSVKQNGKLVATGRVPVLASRVSLADFQLRRGGLAGTRLGVLGSTAASVKTPPRAGALKGRVLDAGGKPVPLALVVVPGAGVVRTNARGEFLIPRVGAGALNVSVRHATLGTAMSRVTVAADRTATLVTMRLPPLPPNRTASPIPLIARDNGAGQVRGLVRDQNNKALPGVRVSLMRGAGAISTLTDRNGRFAFRGVSPGAYRAVVARAGFETATRDFTLRPKGEQTVDVKLKQLTALVDTMRHTAAARRVAPVAAGRAPAIAKPAPVQVKEKPAAAGAAVKPAPPAAVKAAPPAPSKPFAQTPPRLAPGRVRGRVIDASTGRPLGGASVSVSGAGGDVTSGDGSYRIDGVTPGTHEVRVSRSGYSAASRTVSVGSGSVVSLDVSLRAVLLKRR